MDEVSIKLPVSGKEVIIRNYTTRKDDEKYESVLYIGVNAEKKTSEKAKSDDEQKISFPLANLMAAKRSYIPRLVKSIDGETDNLKEKIDDLRSEDYEVLEAAVEKVVEEHSPKAKGATSASKNTTKAN